MMVGIRIPSFLVGVGTFKINNGQWALRNKIEVQKKFSLVEVCVFVWFCCGNNNSLGSFVKLAKRFPFLLYFK